MRKVFGAISMAIVLLAAAVGPATAETPPPEPATADSPPEPTPPWSVGVPQAKQDEAQALYARANQQFLDKDFVAAAATYREALRLWDHPSIAFNLAICLIELQSPVDAYEVLEHSLRFGQGPHDDRIFREAQRNLKLVRAGLARIVVRCDEPGAQVSLDGEALFTAPGAHSGVLAPGQHVVVAEKVGFVTSTQRVDAPAGRETEVTLTLDPLTRLETVYPMSPAVPWIVAASGLALAAGGVPLWLEAERTLADYDAGVSSECAGGCSPERLEELGLTAERDRSDAFEAGAITLFALGGAALATGITLLILNSPDKVEVPLTEGTSEVVVAPTPGGATALIRF